MRVEERQIMDMRQKGIMVFCTMWALGTNKIPFTAFIYCVTSSIFSKLRKLDQPEMKTTSF